MQVPIIDFASLVGTSPVGHSSTSMVYPAVVNRAQLVAVKVFSVDEITIESVADSFREHYSLIFIIQMLSNSLVVGMI